MSLYLMSGTKCNSIWAHSMKGRLKAMKLLEEKMKKGLSFPGLGTHTLPQQNYLNNLTTKLALEILFLKYHLFVST